jgi:hypothetical protein
MRRMSLLGEGMHHSGVMRFSDSNRPSHDWCYISCKFALVLREFATTCKIATESKEGGVEREE